MDRIGLIPIVHLRAQQVPFVSAIVKRAFDLAIAVALLPIVGLFLLLIPPRAA